MNLNSYAPLTQPLNYNKGITSQKPDKIENSYSFNMYQNKMSPIDTNNICYSGNSTLALKSMMENTPVSIIFFSDKNIDRIQKQIKIEINKYFKGKMKLLVDQDKLDLIQVMRYIYFEYGKNLPFNYAQQVKELNIRTIKYIIPDMITNIKQQYDYIRDINSPMKTLDRPLNVNSAGRRSLPSTTAPWGF